MNDMMKDILLRLCESIENGSIELSDIKKDIELEYQNSKKILTMEQAIKKEQSFRFENVVYYFQQGVLLYNANGISLIADAKFILENSKKNVKIVNLLKGVK